MEEKNVIKQIEELSDKATKYEHMKNRYIEIAKKIKDGIEILNDVVREIDPLVNTKGFVSGRRAHKGAHDERLAEQYKKMEMGFSISINSLRKDYPDASDKNINYILYNKLSKAPKVLHRRNNGMTEYYIQKEM